MARLLAHIIVMICLGSINAWAGQPIDESRFEGRGRDAVTARQNPEETGRRKVPLKLADAVSLGLTRNVELKKSILDRATQRMDLELAERMFEPEFTVKGNYDYSAGTNSDTRGLGLEVTKKLRTAGELSFSWSQQNALDREANTDQDEASLNMKFSQPLLRNAGITVGTAQVVTARNTEAQNALAFRSDIMGKITSIMETYWDLLLAMENQRSTIRSLEASREVLERNRALIRAGRKAATDLVSAEQEVARNQVSVLEQQFAVETANRSLVNLLDLDEEVEILPVEGFVYKSVTVDYQKARARALEQNPDLARSKITVKQSELDLTLAKSAALDQVNLEVSTSKTGTGEDAGKALKDAAGLGAGWQAGLGLSIPLGLPRDKLKHQVTIAKRNLKKAKMDLHNSRRNVLQAVRDRVNDVNRTLRQIRLAQKSRELARQKYEIERTRLELGRTTNFQVLSYQRDLAQARDQEHQSIATYLKSLARLDQAVGETLETWNVEIQEPVLPKLPSINMSPGGKAKGLQTK